MWSLVRIQSSRLSAKKAANFCSLLPSFVATNNEGQMADQLDDGSWDPEQETNDAYNDANSYSLQMKGDLRTSRKCFAMAAMPMPKSAKPHYKSAIPLSKGAEPHCKNVMPFSNNAEAHCRNAMHISNGASVFLRGEIP